ncbi:hypothetical protein BBJ28_00019251 [Nothophytophthora sp. Chile5]|nr:hypothetical protein BBJ28_00019251 [Nothophytophthora sp. Chile5]
MLSALCTFGNASFIMSSSMAGSSDAVGQPLSTTAAPSTSPADVSSSSDQWRVFLGLALLASSYVFRVEVVRFSLRVARRVLPSLLVWLREFEKTLLRPLSWVVFVLLAWFSVYVMDLETLLDMEPGLLTSIVTLLLGLPLIWVVICFCNYVTWVLHAGSGSERQPQSPRGANPLATAVGYLLVRASSA